MATDKRQTSTKTSELDATLGDPFRRVLEQSPTAFAVSRGTKHTLIYANAAFRALPGRSGGPKTVSRIGDLFHETVTGKLTAFLDRAMRESCALHDRFLGPLEPEGRPWSCSIWPLMHHADLPHGLVIELSRTTPTELPLSLQREVAERLLLSALRHSEAADDAEASHQRADFLATTGAHLAESLDTDTTRRAVSQLTLPPLVEWCFVDLIEADGSAHRLTIIHREASKQALVTWLDNRWSPETGDPFGVPAVLGNAQPVIITDHVDEALAAAAHHPENLRVLRELGIGRLMTVPLIAETRVFGAITFVSAAGERAFTDQDLELAEGLAARSALALESARRYGDTLLLKDRAEAAARTATRFVGTISHELRTPLNAIIGYVELMDIHGPLNDAQRVDLERIVSSERHLLVLVSELLNFMRVGSGRVLYDAVDVSIKEAVTQAVELLEPLIAKKGLTCRIVADCAGMVASADLDSVLQILVNLISNAIKFSKAGEITIACKTAPGSVSITVSDTGRGIPADKLELIFEPFEQADPNDAREYGGIGLGLPISRDLARAMHGDIVVESTLGQGSKFTLTLPSYGSTGKT